MPKSILQTLGVLIGCAALVHAGGMRSDDGSSGKRNGQFRAVVCKADLTGEEEVPPVDTETTGEFEIRFNDDFSAARFELEVDDGEAITQAHLHCNFEGANGPVIAFLFGMVPGGFDVDGDLAAFTLTDANIIANVDCLSRIGMNITSLEELAMAIEDGAIYANVHSVANPGGEIRAQLDDCRFNIHPDGDDDNDNDDNENENENDNGNDNHDH